MRPPAFRPTCIRSLVLFFPYYFTSIESAPALCDHLWWTCPRGGLSKEGLLYTMYLHCHRPPFFHLSKQSINAMIKWLKYSLTFGCTNQNCLDCESDLSSNSLLNFCFLVKGLWEVCMTKLCRIICPRSTAISLACSGHFKCPEHAKESCWPWLSFHSKGELG